MTPAEMRAAVVTAPRSAEVSMAPVPAPGPGHVRIRLEGCGVCGSNLAVWRGQPWFRYPLDAGAPGHEGWGQVDALGDDVTGLTVGQRVAVLSSHAFAEYDVAPADAVVPLPARFDGKPFPGEALACAVNVVSRAGLGPGETVAIVGVGFLGACIARLAVNAGATVIAISRRAYALELAQGQGAALTVKLDDVAGTVHRVSQLVGANGCDCAIEAAGTQEALDVASALVRTRGRLVIAGYHQDGPRQVDMQSWNWRGIDVINAHERDPRVYGDALRAAIEAIERGAWEPATLYTHTFDLASLGDALNLLDERPTGFLKALVTTS